MSDQEYPTVDGFVCSWADIQIKLDVDGGEAIETSDIAAVKWSRKVDVGQKRGTSGGIVTGTTAGTETDEASMTFYRAGLQKLIRSLAKVAPQRGNQRRIGLVRFLVVVQHTPIGTDEVFTTRLKGCRYLGDSSDMKEGPEADQIEVTLNPVQIAQVIDGEEIVLL